MTILYAVLRNAHIAMGAIGLLAGLLAMIARKGSLPHARVGLVFFVSMTAMALSGTLLSIAPELDRLNVTAGTLTLYLVATAWVTVLRPPGDVGRAERVLAAFGVIGSLMIAGFAVRAYSIPAEEGAVPFFAVFGGIFALATLGDLRVIARGGVYGRARTTRHLWRMCTTMLIATASLFLGQPLVFPAAVRESGLLPVPPILVILALLYFVVQQQVWPRIRRARSAELTPQTTPSPAASSH